MRIKWQPREKTAILKLRKLGYSVNQLSTFFGRSVSLIHRIVKFNEIIGAIPHLNLRTMPNRVRLLGAQNHRFTMERYIQLWEAFILGEVDRPP
jgi:hypothetical protein